ncbi:MAG TPA: flagellar protein FlgN [Thermoanaerobacterales bacterium]|jgi:Mg2+ and Co2+ transporter CorA|nr:flagellar protein FlgN [Thermoanaerobacterales bacterium]
MKKGVSASVLIKVMREQLEAYKELLHLAEEKSDVLIQADVKLLGEITEIEQNLILKLGKLEEERIKLIEQIAKAYNKEASKVKADFYKSILNKEEAKAFSAIYDELRTVLPEIEVKNRRNEKMIKNALDYIDYSIKLLTDAGETKANYGADGSNAQKAFHIIDKKA